MSKRYTPAYSRTWQLLACAVVLAAAAIVFPGCGTGSSSGSGNIASGGLKTGIGASGSNPLSGNTGNTGGAGAGSAVPEATRAADFASITKKIKTLGTPPNYTTLPAYCKTLPGVLDSEAETDGNITVTFTDGEWLVIFNNRPSTGPVDMTPFPGPGSKAAKTRDLPTGNTVRTIEYFAGSSTIMNNCTQMLDAKGYDNVVSTDASIYNFANLGFSDVVIVDTHGGLIRILDPTDPTRQKTTRTFGMITNTMAPYTLAKGVFTPIPNQSTDPVIVADIKAGTVGFAMDGGDLLLAVRPAFLQATWIFPPASIIFNSVCESDEAASQDYNQMCTGNSCGAFFGYDNTVLADDATNDAQQLFEGLLGTHIYNPMVRGRAWNVNAYYSGMKSAGLTAHFEELEDGSTRNANLIYTAGSGSFTGLCPGIEYMYTKEVNSQLVIVGDFGSQTGTVTINGQTIASNWSSTQITCTLPTNPNDPQASGPVVVSYNGHDSNQVNLTKYVGTLHYEHDDIGSLVHTADMKLYFRGDVHLFRATPFAEPSRPSGNAVASLQKSTCSYSSVGEWSLADDTVSWSGSGTLTNQGYSSSMDGYTSTLAINYTGQSAMLAFNFEVQNGYTVTSTGVPPAQVSLSPDMQVYTNQNPNSITLQADQSLNLTAYNGPKVSEMATPYGTPICFVNVSFTDTPTPDSTLQEDMSSD